MATQNLIRWGGLVSIVAAVLLVATAVLNVNAPTLAGAWAELLALALMLYGLMALYVAQAKESGALGLVGFVLGTLGTLPVLAFAYLLIARLSGIEEARTVIRYYNTVLPLFLIGPVVWFVGWFLFGLATLRAGVLPRWAGILLAVGAVVALVGSFLLPPIVAVLAFAMMGIAFAWMGYALWSSQRAMAAQPQPKPAT